MFPFPAAAADSHRNTRAKTKVEEGEHQLSVSLSMLSWVSFWRSQPPPPPCSSHRNSSSQTDVHTSRRRARALPIGGLFFLLDCICEANYSRHFLPGFSSQVSREPTPLLSQKDSFQARGGFVSALLRSASSPRRRRFFCLLSFGAGASMKT